MKKLFLISALFFSIQGPAQQATCLDFDGVDDYIEVPHNLSNVFTVEYWMKTTAVGSTGSGITAHWWSGCGIVDAEMPSWQHDWGTSLYGSQLAFGIGGLGGTDVTIFSTSNVNTGNWVHVAVTWESSTGVMQLFINGVLEASGTGDINLRSAPQFIAIGRLLTGVNCYFGGVMDELRIWNIVRSPGQISTSRFCELSSPGALNGLIAYYKFNQGIAFGSNPFQNSLLDVSPTVANGFLNNFTLSGNNSNWINGAPTGTSPIVSISGPTVICKGSSIILTANGASTYQWSVGSNASSVTLIPTGTTVVTVTGTNGNSICSGSATRTINVQICEGLKESDADNGLRIFPNPSSEVFNINSASDGQVNIFSLDGKLVYTFRVNAGEDFEIKDLSPGVYTITFKDGAGIQTKKVVVGSGEN